PVVTIVVEGGRDTITNIYYDLRADIPVVIIDGSGRVADFFKHWLLYTKEFDNLRKDFDTAYDIDEIDKVTPVTTMTTSSSNHDDVNNSKSSYTYVQLQLDKSRKALQEMFSKYTKQIETDLQALIIHEENSKKKKQKSQSSNNSKDEQPKELNIILRQVMYCLQPAVRSGISVFNLNSDNNLSETIFRSICKSRQKYFERKETDQNDTIDTNQRKFKPPLNSQDKKRQANARQNVHKKDRNAQRSQLLLLAMDWNCIDVAKELILQNSLDNILNKEEAFIYALTKDLPTFIYEFLKLGIDPSEVFFPNDKFLNGRARYDKFISSLYKDEAVNSDTTHLRWFLESHSDLIEKHIHTIDDLNAVLSTLIGDYMNKLYFNNEKHENTYRLSWSLDEKNIEQNQINIPIIGSQDDLQDRENRQGIQDYIMRDLFLWSILMNHIDMAKVLLSYVKYRICAALIATKILKEYYSKATHGELKDSYMKNANYFQQYAIDCITQCEKNDPDQACQIVLQRIELYGNVTCLQVAADANDKLFIATPCCVQAMNNICLQPYGITYSDPYPLEYPRYTKILPINRYMHRVRNFHQALRIKYWYHCVFYCFFLLLFSYTLLFKFERPTNEIPSIYWTEIVTIIFVSCMLIEEIHYFACLDNLSLPGKCFSYFRNLFKILTISGFVLFYIGLILRFTRANTDDQFIAARVIMAIDLEIWWLRSLSFIIVIRFLGPHIVAIGKMLKDLAFFMCIIFIVMAGYGVASRSMVHYPNANKLNVTDFSTEFNGRSIFRQIAYPIYYLMYGEFGNELSTLDGKNECKQDFYATKAQQRLSIVVGTSSQCEK
ncbi:unnamed protein product, partial [Rotaria sordida]